MCSLKCVKGTFVTVRIYTPEHSRIPAGGSPVYVAYHEGGWCFGDLADEEMNCRMISKELGAVCFNVDYRYSFLPLHLAFSSFFYVANVYQDWPQNIRSQLESTIAGMLYNGWRTMPRH
jgi:hypothetical protein